MKVFHVLTPDRGAWRCKVCTRTWPDLPPLAERTGCAGVPIAPVVSITKRRAG